MLQPSGEKGQNILSETIEVKAGEGFLLEPHTAHMYRADENDMALYLDRIHRPERTVVSPCVRPDAE